MNDLDDALLLERLRKLHQKILETNQVNEEDFQQPQSKRRNLRLKIDNVICHYHRVQDAISFVFKQDVTRTSLNIRPLFGFEPGDTLAPIPAEKKKQILQKVQKNCFKKHPIFFDRSTEKDLSANRFCYNVPIVNGSRVYVVGDYSLSVRELTYLMTWEEEDRVPKFKVEIKATSDEQVNFGAAQGDYSFVTISLNLHIEQNETTTFYPNIRYCLQQFEQVCSAPNPLRADEFLPFLKPFLDA